MKRLTERNENGRAFYPKCFDTCGGIGCVNAKCGDKFDSECCERIAAYEDTGLEPEEINNLFLTQKQIGVTFEHVHELLKAEKEGRLIMLPCKAGDSFMDIRRFYKRSKVVKEEPVKMTIDHFTIGDMGIPIASACSDKNEWIDYNTDDIDAANEEVRLMLKSNLDGRNDTV